MWQPDTALFYSYHLGRIQVPSGVIPIELNIWKCFWCVHIQDFLWCPPFRFLFFNTVIDLSSAACNVTKLQTLFGSLLLCLIIVALLFDSLVYFSSLLCYVEWRFVVIVLIPPWLSKNPPNSPDSDLLRFQHVFKLANQPPEMLPIEQLERLFSC